MVSLASEAAHGEIFVQPRRRGNLPFDVCAPRRGEEDEAKPMSKRIISGGIRGGAGGGLITVEHQTAFISIFPPARP